MNVNSRADRQRALQHSIGSATSYLQTQESALHVAAAILERISQLYTLATDAIASPDAGDIRDEEFARLQAQLSALETGSFNGVNLFGRIGFNVAVADDHDSSSNVAISAQDLGGGLGTVTAPAVTSLRSPALGGGAGIGTAIRNIAALRANNGAEQSRLSFASARLTAAEPTCRGTLRQICDLKVAQESTNLAKSTRLVRAGISTLAQTNHCAQSALKLINGG